MLFKPSLPFQAPHPVENMNTRDLRFETVASLRQQLRLSRSEFARFLGVSEATIVRWEVKDSITEPKGLQAVLIRAIRDAMATESPIEVARLIRSCGLDHRAALRRLLAAGQAKTVSNELSG
jgi:DNA-binding XRE family transcriptional regulator